jgi:hypothetical protein
MGGERNEHGTRIARRIDCSRCGAVDHVPFVPQDPSRALCRACAGVVMKMYEEGVKIRMPTKQCACNLCGVPFELPITAVDDGDPLCQMCLQGFTAWQGSVDTPFEQRKALVHEKHRAGTVLRKKL